MKGQFISHVGLGPHVPVLSHCDIGFKCERKQKEKEDSGRVGSLEDTIKEAMGSSWLKCGKIQGPE